MGKCEAYYNDGGRIENQYNSSFCSAFSTTSYLTAYYSRILGRKIEFSPLFAMRNSKLVDGNKGSTGTYLDLLMDEVLKKGCCEENLYDLKDDNDWLDNKFEVPSRVATENAVNYKPYKKKKIDVTVGAFKQAVLENAGCLLALNIFESYFDAYKGVYIRRPKGTETSVVGRHAIYLCGFNDHQVCEYDGVKYKGFFVLQESYGERTQAKGYKFLPYDFVAQRVGGLYSNDRFIDDAYVYLYKKGEDKFATIDKDFKVTIPQRCVELKVNSDLAYIDGVETKLQCPAIIEQDRTFVPLRFVSEAFGASVYYNQETKGIRIFSKEPNYVIVTTVGDTCIVKNTPGEEVVVNGDAASFVRGGVTLVPLRVLTELLGCRVNYVKGVITITGSI